MKTIFTFAFALTAFALSSSAQGQHAGSAMKFAGKSSFSVAGATVNVESDTVKYLAAAGTQADITIPTMRYSMGGQDMTIPSFTIHGATFSFDFPTMTATFADQTFSETVTVDGEEKTITGTSLVAAYKHDAFNTFTLTITFTYGKMPMPITYAIEAYYIKAYTDKLDVVVGEQFPYENASVTYNVRTYPDGDATLMDIEVPAYSLEGTVMGDLEIGGYTVKGLAMDEEKGGFYRDYSADGLYMHLKAVQKGAVTMDGDYPLSDGVNDILLATEGKTVNIVNAFKPGRMPFGVVTTFPGVMGTAVKGIVTDTAGDASAYNMAGQRVNGEAKGLLIRGGKKYIAK